MNQKNYRVGLLSALCCGMIWGLLPVYWNALKPIDSFVIIFYRMVLMALVCFIACAVRYGVKGAFQPLIENKRKILVYIAAGVVITLNWSIYIWAVNAGFVIQTSMGYFLEPLIVCLFGMIFYKERANGWKKFSLILAVIGLLIMIIGYRQLPMIAIGLGLTFAVYSAIKKSVFLSPIQSLLYETIFLAPVALGFIFYFELNGNGAIAVGDAGKFCLLLLAGLATAIPLGLFSFAANKLPLITLGLTEYISPSISLLLGIFLFREPFDGVQFCAFVVIWIGLAFFTHGEVKEIRNSRQEDIGDEE
ncbi:MAG: EamA family transporter RarD [Anaerovoracaceae bacterium]